jgi:hypothetical protein
VFWNLYDRKQVLQYGKIVVFLFYSPGSAIFHKILYLELEVVVGSESVSESEVFFSNSDPAKDIAEIAEYCHKGLFLCYWVLIQRTIV